MERAEDGHLPLVTGTCEVTLDVASLASDLSCPICLEYAAGRERRECAPRGGAHAPPLPWPSPFPLARAG